MKYTKKQLLDLFNIYKCDLFVVFLAVVAFILLIPLFTYLYFAHDLQSKEAIMNRNNTGLTLLDRNNKPFFTFYQANYKAFVPISQIPKATQDAVVSIEDKNFYQEPGFSITGIVRSAFKDLSSNSLSYGGSTITQQLVKNSLLSPQKSFLRKYQEIVLAQELNRRYTKQQVLEMYLNSVYFGKGSFGIEEAAQNYFGKDAKDLNLSESSYLAGLLNAPTELSSDTALARKRQVEDLTDMQQQGYITVAAQKQAQSQSLVFHPNAQSVNTYAPHFALMIRDALVKKYGEEQVSRSGFEVRTTLDLSQQEYAEQVVKQQVQRLAPDNVSNGAAVVIDPKTGEVRALVGSYDWNDDKNGKVNMATTPRQVGSSFKPIIYSEALFEHKITPATILEDVPTTFPGNYKPHDYDYKYRGIVTVRRALSNSLNIPAVEVMQKVGVEQGLQAAKRFGITTLGTDSSKYGLSLILGAGEVPLIQMTDAYAAFANSGNEPAITTILSIKDKNGDTIYKVHESTRNVVSSGVAYLISSILSDNKARAEEFDNALTIDRTAAVKTGTTDDFKDALTIGYTPSLVVGVWVGNNNNAPMDQIAGSLGAAPIWKDLMQHYLLGTPNESFVQPSSVTAVSVCTGSGLLARPGMPSYTEYFLQGTEPKQYCLQPKPTPKPTDKKKDTTPTPPPTQPSPQPTLQPVVSPTTEPSVQPPTPGQGQQ